MHQVFGDLVMVVLGDVIHLWSPPVVTDRKVVLGAMTAAAGTFAARLAAWFVALDEGAAQQTIEWGQLAQELSATSAQSNRSLFAQLGAHKCQATYITGLLVIAIDSFVNLLALTLR